MNIRADYWPKPIPIRRFDWVAVDDETYDGEGCPVGYGATEAEAVADLLEQIEDYRPNRVGGALFGAVVEG